VTAEMADGRASGMDRGRRKPGMLRGKARAAPDAWDPDPDPDPERERLFQEGDPNLRGTSDDYPGELAARSREREDGGSKS